MIYIVKTKNIIWRKGEIDAGDDTCRLAAWNTARRPESRYHYPLVSQCKPIYVDNVVLCDISHFFRRSLVFITTTTNPHLTSLSIQCIDKNKCSDISVISLKV